jgi:hypothetical protein
MLDEVHISLARRHERAARLSLEAGCAEDLAWAERLFASRLTVARRELQACLAGAGSFGDPSVDRVVIYRAAQEIVGACARSVADSANLRFRARFRMYADAVCESEARLIARPRKVTLPRLDLGDVPTPIPPISSSPGLIDTWVRELRSHLRTALQREVETAKSKLVRRVIAGIARSRAAHARKRCPAC